MGSQFVERRHVGPAHIECGERKERLKGAARPRGEMILHECQKGAEVAIGTRSRKRAVIKTRRKRALHGVIKAARFTR